MPEIDSIAGSVGRFPFQHCLGLEWSSQGWVSPDIHLTDMPLLSLTHNTLCLCLKKEEKVLPAGVINDQLLAKISLLEAQEARKVGRKEKQELKEQITDDLLPRAFTRSNRIVALLNIHFGWMILNTSIANKAEDFLSFLRESIPMFPSSLPRTIQSPCTAMTGWLHTRVLPAGFVLDDDCELKIPEENGAVIKCSHQDLTSDEIQLHLNHGKVVTRLGLIWRDRISFVLTDTLQLKSIQFLDTMQEVIEQAGDDMAEITEATYIMMSEEFSLLINDLVEVLGGLQN